MLQEYDDFVLPEGEDIYDGKITEPDFDNEFVRAKTFLQTGSSTTGDNLYDHLTDVLNKILAERPENVIDFFEEYSRKVKEKRFKPLTDHLEDIYVPPARYELAKKWEPLLKPPQPVAPSTQDPEDAQLIDMAKLDLMQLLYYFEQAGIGLPKHEIFTILMSIIRFIKTTRVTSLRFWGKIHGLFKNYLVLETTLSEEEIMKMNQELARIREEEIINADETEKQQQPQEIPGEYPLAGEGPDDTNIPRKLPPLPQVLFEELPDAPNEVAGVGANSKYYYVCNEPGDEWIRLPDVTAEQIRVSRFIRKSLTGSLTQPVITYPRFPGTEMNLLRTQIARISAGTQISPLGFYTFSEGGGGGEEEEEEEPEEEEETGGAAKTTYKENPRFEAPALRDMIDHSMSFWVHHTLNILPQGRTTWWNPVPAIDLGGDEELGGEEEEDEDKPRGPAGPEPETGPPLLTPLSEDSTLETTAAWSVRASSALTPSYAIAVVRSNVWPGAFCFATQGKLFQNIYLGDGLKYVSQNFSPKPLPGVQQDYPLGPEIMEIDDPTGAEEEAWRIAHLPPEKPPKGEEGEEELGEEEEAEDEEEDEDD